MTDKPRMITEGSMNAQLQKLKTVMQNQVDQLLQETVNGAATIEALQTQLQAVAAERDNYKALLDAERPQPAPPSAN